MRTNRLAYITSAAVVICLVSLTAIVHAQGFCFNAALNYAAGLGPHSVVATDLDGDGDLDIVVANYGSNNVSVLKNNGNGTYALPVNYAAGTQPMSVVATDLDADGDRDLAVANWGSSSVSILKNNGNGTFAAAGSYPVGSLPRSVVASDLDGDGDQDLAVANYGSSTVSVLKNNGNGTFVAWGSPATAINPSSVFAADLDGDGDQDLAVANYSSNNVIVLINSGNATFAPASGYAAGSNPLSVFADDLDGDGDQDLAVANYGSNSVSVLKNNGNGTFAGAGSYGAGANPNSVFAADLDGDGDRDLAVANFSSNNVSVLGNNGNGTYTAAVNYAAGSFPYSVFAADLDGDTDRDLGVANQNTNNVSVLINCQNRRPNAICQNVTKDADANCEATVTPAEVNYLSSDPEGPITLELVPPGPFAKGVTPVQLIVTDAQGAKDTCDATVTVLDTERPKVTCPAPIVVANDPGRCGAVVTFSPSAADNCPGVSVAAIPPSGSAFPVGMTTVSCIATDAAGNADTCHFTVTVNDTEKPMVSCPSPIVAANETSQCGAVVTFNPIAADNCPGVAVASVPLSGSFFPVGMTTVACIATDAAGRADTCHFTVTVRDAESPVVQCHADTVMDAVPGEAGAYISFSSFANDNCPGASVVCDPPSGSFFPGGVTHVACIAVDAAGNADTCGFDITVRVCNCPHQGDMQVPNGSGAIDVNDVLKVIGIAFVNGTDVTDPQCPKMRGDVNNSGAVDVNDVLYIIKTAFTNGPAPVNPCGP